MPIWTCEQCEKEFKRKRAGNRPIRFCSQPCYHAWRKENNITTGQFKPGDTPWNKGKKGIHLSPETEFKEGEKPANHVPVGTVRIREFSRSGKKRAFVKVAEPNVWRSRARVVWEKHHGGIPKGKVIHHIDRDTLNDSIENLEAISRAKHLMEHRPEFEEARIEALRSYYQG